MWMKDETTTFKKNTLSVQDLEFYFVSFAKKIWE